MPLKIDDQLTAQALLPNIKRLFDLSAAKISSLQKSWKPERGAPVFTVQGRYTSRGWTEWTQGFQFGSALLQFDATGERSFLEYGRAATLAHMAPHLSHVGVHDHGFNNVSTYGNLLRLMREGRLAWNERESDCYELALKISGAVQAARWTQTADGTGFIHSFNGPHSLFVDTIRSCRALAVADRLGHVLMGEQDARISLLQRLADHALNTARYNVYYGEGRDAYDVRGRTAHEAVFNPANGSFRCPNSQQGYSPFSTWTRGLAWAICGFAELLEFLDIVPPEDLEAAISPATSPTGPQLRAWLERQGKPPRKAQTPNRDTSAARLMQTCVDAATATADFYLENTCTDGIPMWDTGAPNLHRLGDYLGQPADPFNPWEPVDSSAATIAAQGLWRLARFLRRPSTASPERPEPAHAAPTRQRPPRTRPQNANRPHSHPSLRVGSVARLAARYRQAALTIARTLFSEPYLSTDPKHQGLILHSVYHRPNGWDYIAPGRKVPNSESSMWGDYHARELALLLLREAEGKPYLTFFSCLKPL